MKDEYDEERSIWNGIKSEGRNIDQLMVSEHFNPYPCSAPMCPAPPALDLDLAVMRSNYSNSHAEARR